MGLGVRREKIPHVQAETPSATTKQVLEINCSPVIPSGKPSNDSFNYPGFSKTLPQRAACPTSWVSCEGDTLLEKGGFGGCGPRIGVLRAR